LLHEAVDTIEPADGGLKRIRALVARRRQRAVGGLACRRPAEMPTRRRLRCRWWPGAWMGAARLAWGSRAQATRSACGWCAGSLVALRYLPEARGKEPW